MKTWRLLNPIRRARGTFRTLKEPQCKVLYETYALKEKSPEVLRSLSQLPRACSNQPAVLLATKTRLASPPTESPSADANRSPRHSSKKYRVGQKQQLPKTAIISAAQTAKHVHIRKPHNQVSMLMILPTIPRVTTVSGRTTLWQTSSTK